MMNVKVLLVLAVLVIIITGCAIRLKKTPAADRPLAPTFTNVGVDEFMNVVAQADVQLLDVRTPEEFGEGHIAGATLVDVNEDDFVERAMAVLDTQRPVAVYCRSGRRSARAARLLAAQGLTVTNLEGGVMAWQDAGKALVK